MPKKIKSDKMFLSIAALLNLVVELAGTADKIVCDGLVFHNVYFDKEILVAGVGRPYNLVIHKFSSTLFFSHTVHDGSNVDFAIVSCQIEKQECHEVTGIAGGYAIAYDEVHDDIYFGGHSGIYKYNFLNKSTDFFAEEGKSIWGIFIRKNFYYIEYPTQTLFVYVDDRFVPVTEATDLEIDNFFVSKTGDIYFSDQKALYKVEKVTRLKIVLGDDMVFRQIVEDKYGDVYFCGSDGVYIEDKPYYRVKKVADIEKSFGLAFDKHDHVVYSDADTIYRLLPSNHSDVCLDKSKSSNQIKPNEFKDSVY